MSSRRQMLEFLSLSRLPAEFHEVKYLESSGTQYIDTGISLNNLNLTFEAKFRLLTNQPQTTCKLFGSHSTMRLEMVALGNSRFWYGKIPDNISTLLNLKDNLDHTLIANKTGVNIDGVLRNLSQVPTTAPTGLYNCFLFTTSNQVATPESDMFANARIYYFKIYDNGTLIRDFVPCYRKADNVAGLYDLVNGVFYTNAGTGTFIVGGNA